MTTVTGTPSRRRGRPADPRLEAFDEFLVLLTRQYEQITCRGVFYQCLKHETVEKTEAAAKLVERRLLKLRREGHIPYSRIVDESRIVYGNQRFAGLGGLAEEAASLYRRDYWANYDGAVQIWVEKRGLAGLLIPTVCRKWGLDLFVAGGQMSETYLYVAGNQIAQQGKPTWVYAMTDFDPGGATIFNTLKNGSKSAPGGLSRFANGVRVQVEQIALRADQVETYALPTRPAKKTDTRSKKFVAQHGDVSVELDAVEPDQLIALVESAIMRHMGADELDRLKLVEDAERESVRLVLEALAGQAENDEPN